MTLTWVPSWWLIDQKVKADEAPFFWLKTPQRAGRDELWLSYKVSSEKAQGKGLAFRSLGATLADNLNWYRSLRVERQDTPRSGWKPETEQRLLAAWHAPIRPRHANSFL